MCLRCFGWRDPSDGVTLPSHACSTHPFPTLSSPADKQYITELTCVVTYSHTLRLSVAVVCSRSVLYKDRSHTHTAPLRAFTCTPVPHPRAPPKPRPLLQQALC